MLLVNTCAVRDNAEQRVIGRVGELQRFKRAGRRPGRRGLHGAATGSRSAGAGPQGGPRGRARRLPQSSRAGRRTPARRARQRHRLPRLGALRRRAAGPGAGGRPPSSPSSAAAITSAPSASFRTRADRSGAADWRTWSGRSRRWPTRAPARSRSLGRPSTAITTAPTTSPTCSARSGRWTASGGCGSPVRIRPISPTGSSRPWPTARRSASTCTCRCRAARMRCSGGCCAAIPASVTSRWSRGSGPRCPGITFSTDIIVGFPGETEEQFQETVSLVAEAGFDDAYTFKYSVRGGHAGGPDSRPRRRRGGGASGSSGSSRVVRSQARRKNMGRVGDDARDSRRASGAAGRPAAGADPHQSPGPGGPARRAAIGEYHQVQLTGTTGSTFTGRGRAAAHWRCYDPQPGRRARAASSTTAAPGPVSRFLRLRHLPRRTCWSTR